MKLRKVLITDSNHRKALAAVRNLGSKNNYSVICGAVTTFAISRFSKYCDEFVKYPDPEKKPQQFIDYIYDIAKKTNLDLIIPMEDITVELFSQNMKLFKNITQIPVPEYSTYLKARDKEKTIKIAEKNNILVPKTFFTEHFSKINDLIIENYPVVIKPRISSGSRGIHYIKSKNELEEKYLKVSKEYTNPMIQEYIPQYGKKYQVLILMNDKNEVKALCTQELIRQFPVNGGPGTLYKTISNKKIENLSIKLLKKIDWFGIACVEFIENPITNEPVLMEINPRFWGTLNLSIKAGIEFPYLLSEMTLSEMSESQKDYPKNSYCQWLLPGDLLNFIFNKNRLKQKIPYFFNKPKNFYDTHYDKEDKKPFFMHLLFLFFNIFKIKNLKNIFKRG